jgi:iron complex transport system ATP-binding protein
MNPTNGTGNSARPGLACAHLCVSADQRTLVEELSLTFKPGTLICVLGCNGSGKTLTLHTLAGIRAAAGGEVSIGGQTLDSYSRHHLARTLGLMMQVHEDGFPLTVAETALMGRHPWLEFWQWDSADDHRKVIEVLASVDLAGLEQRQAATLSGGERQRLALAALLVQSPDILLLDEPLNHLDPAHRIMVMEMLAGLASAGRTVIASIHDPATASRYADAVLLLDGSGGWEFGPAGELLTPERMTRLYGVGFRRYRSGEFSALLPEQS